MQKAILQLSLRAGKTKNTWLCWVPLSLGLLLFKTGCTSLKTAFGTCVGLRSILCTENKEVPLTMEVLRAVGSTPNQTKKTALILLDVLVLIDTSNKSPPKKVSVLS